MIELKGHSGCKLFIIDENGEKRVKKCSSSISYNHRLEAQMEKQKTLMLKGFRKCNIYQYGYEEGLFYFTMDYINGENLAECIPFLELDGIKKVVDVFSSNIVKYEKPNFEASKVFKEKILSLKIASTKKTQRHIKDALNKLLAYDWKYIISSPCHGDLTLENIILQGKELILIDCLDSFYDSWLIDMAKIFQDTDLMWAYRNRQDIDSNLIIRLTVMRDLLLDQIGNMFEGEKLIETIYHILLLNVMRIYPYVKDMATELFLDSKVKYLIDKIDEKKWR